MNIGKMLTDLGTNCRRIIEMAYDIEATEEQGKLKNWIKNFSTRLLNFFFVVILIMALYLGGVWLYEKYGMWLPFLSGGLGKNIAFILTISVAILLGLSHLIKALLWFFKWVTIVDLFKLYIFVELSFMFVGYVKADQKQRTPIVLEMVDQTFHTDFFKIEKVEEPKTN